VVTGGAYFPARGDLVWINFDPQAGHEQAGRRPALVISPVDYNARVGLVLVCPITSRVKGYPFEVSLPKDVSVSGVVLADQVRSVDWRARRCMFADHAPAGVLDHVLAKLAPLIDPT
jgi:mRNA interferase MazF